VSTVEKDAFSEFEQSTETPALETEDVTAQVLKTAPGAVPMAKRGMIYTMTAAQGVNSAELINAAMSKKQVGKATPRRVVVAAPDGPSTSGGKHARQSITLVPVSGQGSTVMCGWLDVAQRAAGLRDYPSVGEQFRARYGHALDVTAEEYGALVRDLEGLLKTIGVSATQEVSEGPRPSAANVVSAESGGTQPLTVVIAVTLAAVAAVVLGVVFFR
jgi:hypothetical protein